MDFLLNTYGENDHWQNRKYTKVVNEEPLEFVNRGFQYPPKLPDEEDIPFFKDALKEIIPEKIKEIIELEDFLIKRRDIKIKALEKAENSEKLSDASWEASKYWWALQTEMEFGEYYMLQKWLKYWLRLSVKSGINTNRDENLEKNGFTEEQIATAKEFPIQDLFEGRLRKMGSRFTANCPFHKETTPSLVIYEHDNSFYCFGCHEWGDAIDFYMKLHKVDFPKAVKALI